MKKLEFTKKIICSAIIGVMSIPSFIMPTSMATENETLTAQDCPYDIEFTKIEAGDEHMSAIDAEGNVWTWGRNNGGQIGNGKQGVNECERIPFNVNKNIERNIDFVKISAGDYNTGAIDTDGNLWMWGSNGCGQLGNGTTDRSCYPINISESLNGRTKFKEISIGSSHTVAIDVDGNLWGWGSNSYNQLSSQNGSANITSPINITSQIDGNIKFSKISANSESTFAIDIEGSLWKIGNVNAVPTIILQNTKFSQINEYAGIDVQGKLWDLRNENILLNDETTFVDISNNRYCSAAIDATGNLWAWGAIKSLSIFEHIPQKVNTDFKIKEVTTGDKFIAILDETGNLWMCGDRAEGAIGDGIDSWESQDTFKRITNFIKIQSPDPEQQAPTLTVNPGNETYPKDSYTAVNVLAPAVLLTYDYNYSGAESNVVKAIFDKWILTGGGTVNNINSNNVTYTYGEEDGILTATYQSVVLEQLTREGYTFGGWYSDSECTEANKIGNAGANYTPIDNITLYAKWIENEPDPEPEDRTLTVKPGSTQYTQKEGTTRQVSAPQIAIVYNYNGSGKTSTTEKPQFDRWTLTGGGTINSINSNPVTYTYGENNGTLTARYSPVTLPTPTRSGYDFKGWYTKATGGSKVGDGNSNYTSTQNIVLYAHWEEEAYYLTPTTNYQVSDQNEESAYIYRINPDITIETLKEQLQTNGVASVYRKVDDAEELVGDDEKLGTGMIVKIQKGAVTMQYEVSVKGDVDGDGITTPTDLTEMIKQIGKETNFEGVQYLALDISNDGKITATDLAAMKQVSIGELDLSTIE